MTCFCRYGSADAQVLAQCLDVLRKSKGGLPGGGEFEEAVSAARVAREVVVVSPCAPLILGVRMPIGQ